MGILEIALGAMGAAALVGGFAVGGFTVVGAARHLEQVERETAGHF